MSVAVAVAVESQANLSSCYQCIHLLATALMGFTVQPLREGDGVCVCVCVCQHQDVCAHTHMLSAA